jgi:hypothetical protein
VSWGVAGLRCWVGRWAAQGRPRVPGCRPRRGSGFSRGSKINTQGVYFWVEGYGSSTQVLRGFRLSTFKHPTTTCLRGCSGRPPGSDSGQRPGHSPWGYEAGRCLGLCVEVALTASGCDSRWRIRQEKPGGAARSRQPAAALGAGITALGHRRVVRGSLGWVGGGPVRGEVPAAPLAGMYQDLQSTGQVGRCSIYKTSFTPDD